MSGIIIGGGREADRASLPLFTRARTRIENEQRREHPRERLAAAVAQWTTRFPDIRCRLASATYNCMGLVFANRRTCIDPDQWPVIRDGDGYRCRRSNEQPQPSDVLLYRDDEGEVVHVALLVEVTPDLERGEFALRVLSQWGSDGEYLHRAVDVPSQLGRPAGIWTDERGTT